MKANIADQLHQSQSQYTYFLLAAAASGIAFVIQKTDGMAISCSMSLIGLAVVSWGISFYSGCKNRQYFQSSLYANLAALQLEDGTHPETPGNPTLVHAAYSGVMKAAEENSSAANSWGKRQFRYLILGAIFFIVWHVIQLINNTHLPQQGS